MKYTFIIIAVAALGVLVFSQKIDQQPEGSEANQFGRIQQAMAGGAILLDVRTPDEYAAGHIEGATNLSLQDIQSGALPDVDTSKTVYVYCRSGNRSAQAAVILKKAGYTVEDLGGLSSVTALGGKIVK
ncbi:MAG: rhodanese-like domain-containing protein [Minisyncoccota bacterium]